MKITPTFAARAIGPAFLAGGVIGTLMAFLAVSVLDSRAAVQRANPPTLAKLKESFRRPATTPFPADNPFTEEKRALGEKLFNDTRLSANNAISCASCHQPNKGYGDGNPLSSGVPGRSLARHTPHLWNLAFGRAQFWDGRARGLEDQVGFPIQNPDEMAQDPEKMVAQLSADADYKQRFAAAFPQNAAISMESIARALATYERTFVSPLTRFDRWIGGDNKALNASEVRGFRLFNGKAQCANCHSGWNFTDQGFYDIGMPDEDRGRGAVLRLPVADHAFKTPGLRELRHSAPYMHDGSMATLTDVIKHYQTGIVARSTLPPELPRNLKLDARERRDLIAFLDTLSSEQGAKSPALVAETTKDTSPAVQISTVSQDDKTFHPGHIGVKRGERMWIVNNDSRTHNVRVFNPAFEFDSGAQEPGEIVEMTFPAAGSFLVFCGIHPKMELTVDVAD
ncbi:MAG: cytochrome c peroxidase [Pseudolabrys sp.]|nr:cytochrome c peroxidase [Pseudolabrys sp.]